MSAVVNVQGGMSGKQMPVGVKLGLSILGGKCLSSNCPLTVPKRPWKEISRKIRGHKCSLSLKNERLSLITYRSILFPQQTCFEEFSCINASPN